MRDILHGLIAIGFLLIAYSLVDDDKRPVVTTKAAIAKERIEAARGMAEVTAPAPCPPPNWHNFITITPTKGR